MDWIGLAQDRDLWEALVNTVKNLEVAYNAGQFLSSCIMSGVSCKAQVHAVG
jgi:hypothetical protein